MNSTEENAAYKNLINIDNNKRLGQVRYRYMKHEIILFDLENSDSAEVRKVTYAELRKRDVKVQISEFTLLFPSLW